MDLRRGAQAEASILPGYEYLIRLDLWFRPDH